MALNGDSEGDYRLDDDQGPLVRLSLAVRGSFLAFVATLGAVFLLIALALSEHVPGVHHGVLSGMLVVWGVSAFVYAGLGHVALRLIGYR